MKDPNEPLATTVVGDIKESSIMKLSTVQVAPD